MATSTTLLSNQTAPPGVHTARKGWPPPGFRAVTSRPCRWLDLLILQLTLAGTMLLSFRDEKSFAAIDLLHLRIPVRDLLISTLCLVVWRTILSTGGLYNLRRFRSLGGYARRLVLAVTGCAVTVALIEQVALHKTAPLTATITLIFWLTAICSMTASRMLLLAFDHSVRPHLRVRRNLLIVGTGSRAADVYEEMQASEDTDYNLVGYVDSDPQPGYVAPDQVIGNLTELEAILMHQVIDEVVIALPMKSQYEVIGDTIALCQRVGVQSQYFTHHFGTALTKKRWATGRKLGRMALETVHQDSRLFLKRAFDFTGAAVGILAISPLLLTAAIAVKLTSPGPVIFRQQRFGFNKRKFFMLKFRSMTIDAEARQTEVEHLNELAGPAFKIANDPRVTPIGNFLRKTSIDELPQLFNVLAGDMSLVGPRPMSLRDVSRFPEAWLMRRFSVKPGLTCLWQASGRSTLDFDRWIELDLEYIDHWSLTLDLAILLKTLPAVLKRHGAT